jgi:hypothetical protein
MNKLSDRFITKKGDFIIVKTSNDSAKNDSASNNSTQDENKKPNQDK